MVDLSRYFLSMTKAVVLVFILSFLTVNASVRAASPPQLDPYGPWQKGLEAFSMSYEKKGTPNVNGGAIDTENQKMSGELRITAAKLNDTDRTKDYYGLYGQMTHGVLHPGPAYDPAANVVSVGYYASRMSLILHLKTPEGKVWDQGPTSTVGTDTTSFNIGGSLTAMAGAMAGAGGSVSAGFGHSYSTPAVTVSQQTVGKDVRWDLALPGVGHGGSPNPKQPSYGGYTWYFGAIFEVPEGAELKVKVNPQIEWGFDYTRGIRRDTKLWDKHKELTWKIK